MIVRLLYIASIVSAYNINEFIGGSSDGGEKVLSEEKDLLKKFGEEGYKERLADAFGIGVSDLPETATTLKTCVTKRSDGYNPTIYGVDISYPIHQPTVSSNYDYLPHNVDPENTSIPWKHSGVPIQPLGDKQTFYEHLMQGCREFYSDKKQACDATERERVRMNLRQPKSMQNYTDFGFKKIRAPEELMTMLTEFWETNKGKEKNEQWGAGNTYTNHWQSPTMMLSVENAALPGGGFKLKNKIWDAARETIQEWTGQDLTPSSLYGIRIYKEDAVLAPHVDRLPLVSSAIINVAQDVDEDWPIEVYAHDGKAYNITMQPGDMVLYESHSVIHGRPFPLKGRFYANVFIHFEPTGHTNRYNAKKNGNPQKQYEASRKAKESEDEPELPPYIVEGTLEAKKWRQEEREKKRNMVKEKQKTTAAGSNEAHHAASLGVISRLIKIAEEDPDALTKKDENGWMPIHEAVRGGHFEIVKYLVDKGSNFNERTNQGTGGTPLWWALTSLDEDHRVIKYLKELGAINLGPEL